MNTDPIQPLLSFGQQAVPFADEHSTAAAGAQETMREVAKRPHIFVALAQNALTVAHSLRDNYFRNTATLVARLREHLTKCTESSKWTKPLFTIESLDVGKYWDASRGEEIAFIDGGVGSVEILSQVPMLLRVGTYKVKAGECMLSQREEFGFYAVILGDLIGGSKERKDYPDIVPIIAELLAVLHTLNRYLGRATHAASASQLPSSLPLPSLHAVMSDRFGPPPSTRSPIALLQRAARSIGKIGGDDPT